MGQQTLEIWDLTPKGPACFRDFKVADTEKIQFSPKKLHLAYPHVDLTQTEGQVRYLRAASHVRFPFEGIYAFDLSPFFVDDPRTTSKRETQLKRHVDLLRSCRKCPKMESAPVSGGPVVSKVMLIGQAPGAKEPVLGRPFAWTAGKAMFKWFEEEIGVGETEFRQTVYMAAVCRCFPGKNSLGGDRVPSKDEVARCGDWLRAEMAILGPGLVIPVGRLAISQFLAVVPMLTELVGQIMRVKRFGQEFDLVPLPHPSGASPWHRIEPGRTLTKKALALIKSHPAWIARI